ncbi:MAG: transglycosylase domain-containing protein, partial [Solirubrobacteraceae bacterium]
MSGIAGALVIGVIAAVGYVLSIAQSAPSLGSLKANIAGASSQVYAVNGTRLGFIQSDELRTPIATSQMPTDLRNATVAIEDQRFYKNNGVDLTGIFRSAVKDLLHGQALQGASTITMQLMRNLYLGSDTHSFKQKIDEAKLAIEYT